MGLSELNLIIANSLFPAIIFHIFHGAKSLAKVTIRFVKPFLCFFGCSLNLSIILFILAG